jgi:dipeptide/tripeptide permease
MAACAIFLFFPIQQINDGGLGAAANAQSASLTSNGVPNDVLDNLNPLAIIVLIPIMNHLIYPLLRKMGIRFGPIARMTFGFLVAAITLLSNTISTRPLLAATVLLPVTLVLVSLLSPSGSMLSLSL